MLPSRFAPLNFRACLYALFVALLPPSTAFAETVYVTDVLRLGIHADKSLNSPITTLVQSGTPLEVLARTDKLLQIKSPGGTIGWVDASLVQAEQTARANVETVRRQLTDAQRSETSLKAEVEALSARLERTEQQRLAAESARTELQAQLDQRQNEAVAGDPAAAAAREKQLSDQLSEALREIEAMAQENRRMQATLESQAQAAQEPPAALETAPRDPPSSRQDPGLMNVLNWALWQQILLVCGCVLAFSLGAYVVDWNARRRHGGFRI